ncbi:right-handed parallel beta-helix repeat-containing protein [Rubellimicrobium aerolatum]|uniref:Right-handed parallel beta-helix repeat-containing protein n=1 Tax=Rubellimicrobium aerolatum TaxID=490979 RepID=A0ABW0SEG1_9RHOB|nr:right-handed parallel beta-helix repeat-containing protein [Rubellimicrobium aerolatum]MBP1806818.1 hypothetical protein [Rubellimicrobium aerolatum]
MRQHVSVLALGGVMGVAGVGVGVVAGLWADAGPGPTGLAWVTGTSHACLREFHVAPTGSDAAAGGADAPWATIGHAVAAPLRPGDCVTLADGTYAEAVRWETGGGAADATDGYVVLRAANRHGALLRPPPGAYSTLLVRASFVVIDGLDVVGGEGHAIDIEDAHHVKVLNSRVHDSGGSGISAWKGEFLWFEGNESFGNTATNGFQGSGISIYWARAVAGDEGSEGFRNVIRGNHSHDNVEGPAITDPHTDGNGIIIDDFRHTQTEGVEPYPHPTLVENNLVHGNGGKGIQVTWSDHVTVRNNTSWRNNTDDLNPGTWRGELSNAQSSDNVWVNNIAVADASINPDNTALDNVSYDGYENRDVTWSHNLGLALAPGGAVTRTDGGNPEPDPGDGNLLGLNPGLVAPEWGDFAPGPGSPAIDAGTARLGLPATDLTGVPRVRGEAVDLGAIEAGG